MLFFLFFFINEAFFYLTSLFFYCCSTNSTENQPRAQTYSKSKNKMSLHYWKSFQNSLKIMWICYTYSLYFHNCLSWDIIVQFNFHWQTDNKHFLTWLKARMITFKRECRNVLYLSHLWVKSCFVDSIHSMLSIACTTSFIFKINLFFTLYLYFLLNCKFGERFSAGETNKQTFMYMVLICCLLSILCC